MDRIGSKRRSVPLFFFLVLLLIAPQTGPAADYPAVTGPCSFSFPRDHGSHPDYRIEWWYYTGNLLAEDGARFGFQLTFFRVRTVPAEEDGTPVKKSAWRADQIFMVHAALSDISASEFHHSEKMSRAALDLAGTKEAGERFEVFVGADRAEIAPRSHRLEAKETGFSFSLDLSPLKEPVAHGDSGMSIKGEAPGEAGCYYSVTRLETSGLVTVGGLERRVRGSAWMDHEFSSAPLDPGLVGWDWFGLQFSDGSELMVYLMREKNGGYSPVSSGTYVDAEGKAVRLSSKDFRIRVLRTWKSPHSGAVYPSSWLLELLPLDLRVSVAPAMPDQEMETPESTKVTYWEGSVSAEGSGPQGRTLKGEGYAELTGYSGAVLY